MRDDYPDPVYSMHVTQTHITPRTRYSRESLDCETDSFELLMRKRRFKVIQVEVTAGMNIIKSQPLSMPEGKKQEKNL